MKPRGVLPTMANEQHVVLCKAALYIRDTYEIRLCLHMAKKHGCSFTLVTPPRARIATELRRRLEEHGGELAESEAEDYSVYCGATDAEGVEQDGWVLGDRSALVQLASLLSSDILRGALTPGSEVRGADIANMRALLIQEQFTITNIDDEDVRQALLALFQQAEAAKGTFFVQ
jgi:hypothetical protein